MRLEFRTSDADEPFSWKRLLLDVGMGIGVFLVFLLIGHYSGWQSTGTTRPRNPPSKWVIWA